MDAALLSAINGAHAPWLDAVMRGASWLGYFPGVWFLGTAAALFSRRHRATAFRALLAVALTYTMASGVVKPLVGRTRPYMVDGSQVRTIEGVPSVTYSFPSGHAATAVAGAIAGSRVVPGASWLLWTLAAVISYSRMYAGVHYPSDVVAGAVLGMACAWLVLGGRHPSSRPWPVISSGEAATVRP